MSSPESLIEDVDYLIKRITFLDGQELKTLCRELELPVRNIGSGDMFENLTEKMSQALYSYKKMPSRKDERSLAVFRHYMLLKSGFLKRYLDRIERSQADM